MRVGLQYTRRGERFRGFQKLTTRKTKNVNSLSACSQEELCDQFLSCFILLCLSILSFPHVRLCLVSLYLGKVDDTDLSSPNSLSIFVPVSVPVPVCVSCRECEQLKIDKANLEATVQSLNSRVTYDIT
jgi:hypothetical protein